jgi:hypothetical protein
MAIQITAKEIEHKDPRYLRQRIATRVAEYNKSQNESRGELLTEIQILTNRIDSIHSERVEKRALFLELVVILLILIEVWQGCNESKARKAAEDNTKRTISALEKFEQRLPSRNLNR